MERSGRWKGIAGTTAVLGAVLLGGWAFARRPVPRDPGESYERVRTAPAGTINDAELLEEVRRGNYAAADRLLLERSPLLAQVAAFPPYAPTMRRTTSLDVPRDPALRPIPRADLIRAARSGGPKGGSSGPALESLWRVDPAAAGALAVEAARDPRSSWSLTLATVAQYEVVLGRTLGEAYIRSHARAARLSGTEIDRRIAALAETDERRDPMLAPIPRFAATFPSSGPTARPHLPAPVVKDEGDRGEEDWTASVPSVPPMALVGGRMGRPSFRSRYSMEWIERELAKKPDDSDRCGRWVQAATVNPRVIVRDPVRAFEIAERAGYGGHAAYPQRIADVLVRYFDVLPERSRQQSLAYVRMYPRDFRATQIGYLALASERRRWSETLAADAVDDSTITFARLWPHLTPEHRARLKTLATAPKTESSARLAEELLNFIPDDPALREHARWALRTPAYVRRINVIVALAGAGDPEALGLLKRALRSPNVLERTDATLAFSDARLDAITAPLLPGFSPYVRNVARFALARRVDPAAVRMLSRLPRAPAPVPFGGGAPIGIPLPPPR